MHGELPQLQVFLEALLVNDSQACLELTHPAVQQPADLRRLYLSLFQPALYRIGDLWAQHQISVAQEHLATAIIQRLMAQYYPLLASIPRHGRRALMTTAPQELHEIGARMVADFLELEGWTVAYLGANTPLDDLRGYVADLRPDVVGISTGIRQYLPRVASTIDAIRATVTRQPLIIVGGQAFHDVPELWRRVGADAYAPTAGQALHVLAETNALAEL